MSSSERVTAVCANLFAAKGYEATSTRELADALGITKGTLYHHFPTKEDLLMRICDESLARITQAAEEVVASEPEPLGRLQALIRRHVKTMLADQALHTTMLTEMRSLSATNHARVLEQRDAYARIIQETIAACQAGGDLQANADTHLLALLLLNMLNWTIFWYRADGPHSPGEIAEATARTVLTGWRTPGPAGGSP
jgi:AcrR family transcriptional regulator